VAPWAQGTGASWQIRRSFTAELVRLVGIYVELLTHLHHRRLIPPGLEGQAIGRSALVGLWLGAAASGAGLGGEAGGLPPLVTMQTMFGEVLLPRTVSRNLGRSRAGGQTRALRLVRRARAWDGTASRSTRHRWHRIQADGHHPAEPASPRRLERPCMRRPIRRSRGRPLANVDRVGCRCP
jgi:hypothetical protein